MYFLGSKGGRCVRLTTLPPSFAFVMKSGKLNFLEHSGPLQACNGNALPLLFKVQLTLREERRLGVFENRVLRRIFEPMWDEVTGEWRKLHIEELSDLHSSQNIVWMINSRRRGGRDM